MPEQPYEVEPELWPLWEEQQPVWLRCGHCPQQRRLAQLLPMNKPSDGYVRIMHFEGITTINRYTGIPATMADYDRRGRNRIVAPRPSIRLHDVTPGDEPRIGPMTRVTFTCHRKCTRTYTWRMDTLVDAYVVAVLAGRNEIIAGLDV
jgi:hypothetical protein